jgi:hypothetical protein
MKKSSTLPLLAVLGFGLSALGGCVSIGVPFPAPVGAVAIVVGKTTQDDVEKTYGAPDMQGSEDGDVTWTYLYLKASAMSPTEAEQLTLRFNKDGTLKSYSFNSSLPNPK